MVYDSLDADEFENGWSEMMDEYEFGESLPWFDRMYELRTMWVPTYLKRFFWAGMSTTQRSEGINAFFKKYVNKKTSLSEFVDKYELALHAKWEKEAAEDFRCAYRFPKLVSSLPFEKQVARAYTNKIFYLFQGEVTQLIGCFVEMHCSDGVVNTYVVREGGSGKEFKVQYCTETSMYHCDCLLFQFKGLVCRHGMAIYRQLCVSVIPECYFLPRWRKDFIRTHTQIKIKHRSVYREMSVYDTVYSQAHNMVLNMVECVYRDSAATENMLALLEQLSSTVASNCDLENPDEFTHHESDGLHAEKVLDPVKVKSVGRPRGRYKAPSEKKVGKNNKRGRPRKVDQSSISPQASLTCSFN